MRNDKYSMNSKNKVLIKRSKVTCLRETFILIRKFEIRKYLFHAI